VSPVKYELGPYIPEDDILHIISAPPQPTYFPDRDTVRADILDFGIVFIVTAV
jgi:hypothetical protein